MIFVLFYNIVWTNPLLTWAHSSPLQLYVKCCIWQIFIHKHTVVCFPVSPGCWLRHSVWEAAGWGGSCLWPMLCEEGWTLAYLWRWGLLHFPATQGQSMKENCVTDTSLRGSTFYSLLVSERNVIMDTRHAGSETKVVIQCRNTGYWTLLVSF